MQDELCFRHQQIWSFKVGKNLKLVLVDGLHERTWPKPDVVILVHQQEVFLWNLFLDLGHNLRIELFKESHDGLHVFLVLNVEEHRFSTHAILQLHCELGDLTKAFLRLVQVNQAARSRITEILRTIFRCDLSENSTD